MIVSVFSDDTRKDKIAEFYDSYMPLFFLHGLLEEARYNDRNSSVIFAVRQEPSECFSEQEISHEQIPSE